MNLDPILSSVYSYAQGKIYGEKGDTILLSFWGYYIVRNYVLREEAVV